MKNTKLFSQKHDSMKHRFQEKTEKVLEGHRIIGQRSFKQFLKKDILKDKTVV